MKILLSLITALGFKSTAAPEAAPVKAAPQPCKSSTAFAQEVGDVLALRAWEENHEGQGVLVEPHAFTAQLWVLGKTDEQLDLLFDTRDGDLNAVANTLARAARKNKLGEFDRALRLARI